MKKLLPIIPIVVATILSISIVSFQNSEGVNENYPEVLKTYLNEPQKSGLPDYSYAGYRQGEATFSFKEKMKTAKVFKVEDYGAIANDGNDDIKAVQKAVDAAGEAGGGVVLFGKGTYDFDVNTSEQFVQIRHSNIVILGAGDYLQGTILHDHTGSDYPDKSKKWLAGQYPSFFYFGKYPSDSTWHPGEHSSLLAAELNPSSQFDNKLNTENAKKLVVGKTYLLTLQDTDSSLVYDIFKPLRKIGKRNFNTTGSSKYHFQQLVTIEKIVGNEIILDAPIMWDLKKQWSPKLWEIPALIEEVALAGFIMQTNWNEPFQHHLNPTHDNGWDHIKFRWVENGWIQNVIHKSTSSAIGISNSKNCTVTRCRIEGNRGHNGFILGGASTRNLLTQLDGSTNMHTFALSGHAVGNVIYNCIMGEPAALDCHGGKSIYNLVDNMTGGVFKHGGNPQLLPPANGRGLTFWNWQTGLTEPYKSHVWQHDFKLKDMPGAIIVGLKGKYRQGIYVQDGDGKNYDDKISSDWGYAEKLNEVAKPASLYRFQKELRLGVLP
ncbi:MAG: DUF4955 domain-containing protein [Bacteroidota bacterium]